MNFSLKKFFETLDKLSKNYMMDIIQEATLREIKDNSPYQIQYKKNFDLVKSKYKKFLFPKICFNEVSKCVCLLQNIENIEFLIKFSKIF